MPLLARRGPSPLRGACGRALPRSCRTEFAAANRATTAGPGELTPPLLGSSQAPPEAVEFEERTRELLDARGIVWCVEHHFLVPHVHPAVGDVHGPFDVEEGREDSLLVVLLGSGPHLEPFVPGEARVSCEPFGYLMLPNRDHP